jgi:hypothetical protein
MAGRAAVIEPTIVARFALPSRCLRRYRCAGGTRSPVQAETGR